MKMKILVADDEEFARKRVIKLLADTDIECHVVESSTGKETVAQIVEHRPDLVFLDIQMTDMTGFDVLGEVEESQFPIIIFVTAFDHYAVKAFEINALDFLLKPFKKDRFLVAFNRAKEQLATQNKKQYQSNLNEVIQLIQAEKTKRESANYLKKIVIKVGKKYSFVPTEEIKYVISSAYYAEIHTTENRKHLYRSSMNDLMEQLDPTQFSRISRSAIINLSKVVEVISEGQGDYTITMKDNKAFSLSKKYRTAFLETMDIR